MSARMADQIVAGRGLGIPDHVRDALFRYENGTPVGPKTKRRGFVDRIITDPLWMDRAIVFREALSPAQRSEILDAAAMPIRRFWIEDQEARFGVLVEASDSVLRGDAFGRLDGEPSLMASWWLDSERGEVRAGPLGELFLRRDPAGDVALRFLPTAPIFLFAQWARTAAENGRRMALEEFEPDSRQVARRNFREGIPNYVWRQCVMRYAGDGLRPVDPTGEGSPLRLHWVRGFWRLYDRASSPYWIWIEDHLRGDAERGFAGKDRMVPDPSKAPRGDPIRRGFVMPAFNGRPGERVPAIPVA